MEVKINGHEVAEAIAEQVRLTTKLDCEAFHNGADSVIVFRCRTVIARVTDLFGVITVAASSDPSNVKDTEIPCETKTVDGLMEVVHALEKAKANVLDAAMAQ